MKIALETKIWANFRLQNGGESGKRKVVSGKMARHKYLEFLRVTATIRVFSTH